MEDTTYLRNQAQSYDNQRTQAELEKRAIDIKLERLREAKDLVKKEKDTIDTLKRGVNSRKNPDDAWQGEKRRQYSEYVSSDLLYLFGTYYDQLDFMHDAIILKIAELENQRRERIWLISWCFDQANNLWARIRTAFN